MNTGLNTIKDVLKIDELAEALQISVSTVYRLTKRREIPFFRVGKQMRFNLEQVKESLIVKSIDQY